MAISRRGKRRRAAGPAAGPRRAAVVRAPGSHRQVIDSEAQRLAHVGSWSWDAIQDVVSWSEELRRIYGLYPGEPVGGYEDFLGRVHPDDRERTKEVVAAAFREGAPFNDDHRIVRSDGAVRMLQTRGGVVRGAGGAVSRLVGCCMDVTDQWEMRRKLKESLSLLRATLDSTADGILVVDLSGKVVVSNRRAMALWNIPPALAARSDLPAMIEYVRGQLSDPDAFLESERRLQEDREAKGVDTIRFKDGRIVERYTQPQRQGDRIVGRVYSFRDVTERDRTLRALKKGAAELEERVRERTAGLRAEADRLARANGEFETFAAAASRDLSAPLRRISAFSELLARRAAAKFDPEELAMLERIRGAAADMTRLISDLLAARDRAPLPKAAAPS